MYLSDFYSLYHNQNILSIFERKYCKSSLQVYGSTHNFLKSLIYKQNTPHYHKNAPKRFLFSEH